MFENKDTITILSIDGGGIRGIIPAVLLAEIEKTTGKKIYELFDFFAGTSTGGILTLLLINSAYIYEYNHEFLLLQSPLSFVL